MNYIKQTRIENVVGFCPHNGDYSYEKKGRSYLVLDGVILEKGEAPCALSLLEGRICMFGMLREDLNYTGGLYL